MNGIFPQPTSQMTTFRKLIFLDARREMIEICLKYTLLMRFNVNNAESIAIRGNELEKKIREANIYPYVKSGIAKQNIPPEILSFF